VRPHRNMSEEATAICNELDITASIFSGSEVDRVDYTKGIP